ncbi:MAG: arylesterase [Bacteroidetes bacterium SB0662_bin_6]|nr:arylesterase [Bacteroidetes bacterium SB0668_bin_1]MYE05017.1 arylesterase [Bacteroidetes bacterium SB0662_bin_6]
MQGHCSRYVKIGKLYLLACIPVLCLACGSRNTETETAAPDRGNLPPVMERNDNPGAELQEDAEQADTIILFLGNSLSAGAGVDPASAFPALLQHRMDSLGWNVQAVNAGLSGETSAGGLRRIDWYLQQYPVSVLVLELGGNDGLRGIPVEVTQNNLQAIIDKARNANPDMEIILAGMQIPPNLGQDYTRAFRKIYPTLTSAENTHLIPFLLEGVGGVDSLMQMDGIHPNESGHRIVAENVWDVLHPVMEVLRSGNDATIDLY